MSEIPKVCVYTPIESNIPYPRKEYKCSCRLRYVLMESEVWDGMEYKKIIPSDNCVKCGLSIEIQEATR